MQVFVQSSKRKVCGFVEHSSAQDTAGSAGDSRHQVMDVSGLQARPAGVLPWQ